MPSIPSKVLKFMYFIRNKAYFNATIRANGIKVGEIIQIEPNNLEGGDFLLISKKFKKAWFKPYNLNLDNLTDDEVFKIFGKKREDIDLSALKSAVVYINGKEINCIVDVNDGIPLYEDSVSSTETSDYLIKTVTKTILKEEKDKTKGNKKVKTGLPIRLKEIGILPSMLFELANGNAVRQMNATPKSKFEALAPVFIAVVIAIVAIAYILVNSGAIHSLT